jgi:hypothetical protein
VLNSARQTGSVLGVALFGSLIGQEDTFLLGLRAALVISAAILVGAAATIAIGGKWQTLARAASRRPRAEAADVSGPRSPMRIKLQMMKSERAQDTQRQGDVT